MELVLRLHGDLVSSPVFILGAATAQDRPFFLGELSQAEMSRCFLDDDVGMFGKDGGMPTALDLCKNPISEFCLLGDLFTFETGRR